MPEARYRPFLFILPALLVLGLLLIIPLCLIVASSFDQESKPGAWDLSFTLDHYRDLFQDAFYLRVLARTMLLSACVTVLSVALGYVLAVKLWLSSPRLQIYLMMIIVAPLLVSIVARTYGWVLILGERGLLNSTLIQLNLISKPLRMLYTDGAVVLGLTHVLIPFAVLSIHASLERIDRELIEAATVAGAGYFVILSNILIPLSVPGIVVGATLVFSLSMSAYVTPALMGGNSSTLATLIYQKYAVAFDWSFGATLAVLLLLASLTGVLFITIAIRAPFRRRLSASRGSP
jgi:putative spermidine/putrescine transport system permease protein